MSTICGITFTGEKVTCPKCDTVSEHAIITKAGAELYKWNAGSDCASCPKCELIYKLKTSPGGSS